MIRDEAVLTIRANVHAKLGDRRAAEAARSPQPGVLTNGANRVNPTGFDGVDQLGRKFRARIRFTDALSGRDVRITLGSYDTAEEAGYAYAYGHTLLWGSNSRYNSSI